MQTSKPKFSKVAQNWLTSNKNRWNFLVLFLHKCKAAKLNTLIYQSQILITARKSFGFKSGEFYREKSCRKKSLKEKQLCESSTVQGAAHHTGRRN